MSGGDKVCGVNLSRDSFELLDSKGRDVIIFDCLQTLSRDVKELQSKAKTDTKRLYFTGGVFGFVGGMVAALARFLFTP
jgi:hypothetical protein